MRRCAPGTGRNTGQRRAVAQARVRNARRREIGIELIDALLDCGATDLTVVNNNAGQGDQGLALLIKEGRVKKMICSFPRQSDSWHFDAKYKAGEIELELVPQGNLAERIRASVRDAGCDAVNLRVHMVGVDDHEIRDQIAALTDAVPLPETRT